MFKASFISKSIINSSSFCKSGARRCLSLHEYISMDILRKHNVPVPQGIMCRTSDDVKKAVGNLKSKEFVVKAQVLAGGRGKGHFSNGFQGGVKVCKSATEAAEISSKMLGANLITKQSGTAGKPCNSVYVCERLHPKKEYYFAILLDRNSAMPMLVASNQGGMDIEAVAEKDPNAIKKHIVDIHKGLSIEEATSFAESLGFGERSKEAGELMCKLYDVYIKNDASMVEINPMALAADDSGNEKVLCMDAKVSVDDNADYKHPEIFKHRDLTQEDKREVEAAKYNLNYIGLDGNIGCLVNGAGLAMATMDLIKLHGGEPANFLDVGGAATVDQVTAAFRIISSDPRVKAIFVNIFGGIMRCDVIAEGVITAMRTLNLQIPVVVRLQGTNVEIARNLIRESKLDVKSEDDLDAAAKLAVSFTN